VQDIGWSGAHQLQPDPNPPQQTVKLIFIHHSTGEGWLADDSGGLGIALRESNYFVSDTNYDWVGGGTDIGNRTDIGNWYEWFAGPNHSAIMASLYAESEQHSSYSRRAADPGGPNQIVMFKSCFPNSHLGGHPDDSPTVGDNPLRNQGCCSEDHNVANAKGIYNDILAYFRTRQDRLFIVITAPPLDEGGTDAEHAANARAFNRWLVNDWLAAYPYRNVAVFDYYNVLTSNGGSHDTNDLGAEAGNHHRLRNGVVQYVTDQGTNYAAYSSDGDSHPTGAGQRKATGEFVALLNVFYHRWQGSPAGPTPTATRSPAPTLSPTSTRIPTVTRTPPTGIVPCLLPLLLGPRKAPHTATPTLTPTGRPTLTPTTPGSHEVTIQRGRYGEVRDAYVWASEPDSTGNWENLYTGRYDEGYKMTLLWFGLESIPGSATVDMVTLWIYQHDGGGARRVSVYRIVEPWQEDSITWNTFSLGDTSVRGSFSADGLGWKTVSLTELVQEWVDGERNLGLVLHDEEAGIGEYEVYHASEYEEDTDLRPKLTIRWH
jgi:hypothetical protein